jgi:putative restriction endonuclease
VLPDEYVSGLSAVESRVSEVQRRLLVEQYHAPSRSVTTSQLAKLAGVQEWKYVNLLNGRLGRIFSEETGLFPYKRPNGTYQWWSIWSSGSVTPQGSLWTMRDQVAEALETLGWVVPEDTHIPEEVSMGEGLLEGATRQITVNAHERNREARRKCIEYYGAVCAVCELDLSFVYGPIAQGFIHVHHLKPLSETGETYKVKLVNDLRPVCPNCHAIIHLGRQTRSIEEVKNLMRDAELESNSKD